MRVVSPHAAEDGLEVDPSASTLKVLGLQECATVTSFHDFLSRLRNILHVVSVKPYGCAVAFCAQPNLDPLHSLCLI